MRKGVKERHDLSIFLAEAILFCIKQLGQTKKDGITYET